MIGGATTSELYVIAIIFLLIYNSCQKIAYCIFQPEVQCLMVHWPITAKPS